VLSTCELALKVEERLSTLANQFYRLLILAGPSGAGKTAVLQEIHKRTNMPYINVNLQLAQKMLDLTEKQRAINLSGLLADIVKEVGGEVILLDNIEILFDPALKQDPLRLLEGISRNNSMVVSWNGSFDGKNLTYAIPEHMEYRKYPIGDVLVLDIDDKG
jgi:hypothetical protein